MRFEDSTIRDSKKSEEAIARAVWQEKKRDEARDKKQAKTSEEAILRGQCDRLRNVREALKRWQQCEVLAAWQGKSSNGSAVSTFSESVSSSCGARCD